MSNKETVEQLHNEKNCLLRRYTDDMDIIHNTLDIDTVEIDQHPWPAVEAIRKLRAELADARRVALSYLRMATERKKELAQARAWLSAAKKRTRKLYDMVTDRNRKLTQAREELESLHEIDTKFGRQAIRRNRDYWYDKAVAAEAERDEIRKAAQEQRDAIAKATEAVRRAVATQAAIVEAAEAVARTMGRSGVQQIKANRRLVEVLKPPRNYWNAWQKRSEAATNGGQFGMDGMTISLLDARERLATLDAAEKALTDCGSRGIYTDFDGPADAIMQMAARIEKLEDETMIEVEITGEEMVETLQHERTLRQVAETGEQATRKALEKRLTVEDMSRYIHELTQTIDAERQLRQEAEQEIRQRQRQINLLMDAKKMGAELWLEEKQRAENAEAQLSNGHGALTIAGVTRSDTSGNLSICGRVIRLRQRAERAETLAQLVNEEMAELLAQLASNTEILAKITTGAKQTAACLWNIDAKKARELAAQIREALDDSQA